MRFEFDDERPEIQEKPNSLLGRVKNALGRRRNPTTSETEGQSGETTGKRLVYEPPSKKPFGSLRGDDKILMDQSELDAEFHLQND